MKLEYQGTWGSAAPFLDGEAAPANPFVAAIAFPSGESIKAIVYTTIIPGTVQDHGHSYRADKHRLTILVNTYGFVTPFHLPDGVGIEIVSTVAADFYRRGDKVCYVPRHAHGNLAHPDVEIGVVSSTNNDVVFVKYGAASPEIDVTSKATYPLDLFPL